MVLWYGSPCTWIQAPFYQGASSKGLRPQEDSQWVNGKTPTLAPTPGSCGDFFPDWRAQGISFSVRNTLVGVSLQAKKKKKNKPVSKSPQVTYIPRGLRTLTLSPEGLPAPSEDLAAPGPWSDGEPRSLPVRAIPLALGVSFPFRLYSEAPCVGCEVHECSQRSFYPRAWNCDKEGIFTCELAWFFQLPPLTSPSEDLASTQMTSLKAGAKFSS